MTTAVIDLGEMVRLIDRGKSVKEIAMSLDCSDAMVRNWKKKLPESYQRKLKENGKANQRMWKNQEWSIPACS